MQKELELNKLLLLRTFEANAENITMFIRGVGSENTNFKSLRRKFEQFRYRLISIR